MGRIGVGPGLCCPLAVPRPVISVLPFQVEKIGLRAGFCLLTGELLHFLSLEWVGTGGKAIPTSQRPEIKQLVQSTDVKW